MASRFASGPASLLLHVTEEIARVRREKREHWIATDLSRFHKSWKWQDLRAVARVRRATVPTQPRWG